MSYAQVETTLRQHPKFIRFAELMGFEYDYQAVGLLTNLWTWAQAQELGADGRIPPMSTLGWQRILGCPAEIAARFPDAAKESGFLDTVADALGVHDWEDYGGGLYRLIQT